MCKLGVTHILKQTNKVHTGAVIFLHGSGDTGKGILDWFKLHMKDYASPHLKFLFPTAPLRPYIPMGGEMSNVWFNRYDITPEVREHVETLASIETEIKKLVAQEVAAGIPLNKIIIGGFSMGGALSLHAAYRFLPGLAGCFALSSFLNYDSLVYKNFNNSTSPLFMRHGDRDTLVPLEWGENSFEKLQKLGVEGEFKAIPNMMHELKKKELEDLVEWFNTVIPPPRVEDS